MERLKMVRMTKKDLLDVAGVSNAEIEHLLKLAAILKERQRRGILHSLLPGKTLGLLFQKPSTRTRVSFEAGMNQLGGHALVLHMADIQLSRGESIADTARVLSRYLDGIVVRTYDHATVEEWAAEATMPVINGLTDLSHPCQALSDLLTIREKKGRLQGVKIAYIGDGNNVANSLVEAAAKMGMTIALGVWISMGREREQARRLKVLAPYQVNSRLLHRAKPDAIVMHCLPAHRGEEITAEVLDGPQSVIIDQAENRLHMQKAILVAMLGKRSKKRR